MPGPPPSQDELLSLAERALSHCDGDAQASARWTRELHVAVTGAETLGGTRVEVTVLRDGRAGRVITGELDDDGLRRAAADAAALASSLPAGALPARLGTPGAGRSHDGYDATVLGLDAAAAVAALAAADGFLRATAAKMAVVSSGGVRAYEQRSTAELRVRRERDGRSVTLAEASVRPTALDAARLAADAGDLLGSGEPATVTAGEHPVVLAPWAVAEVLRRAARAFAGAAAARAPLSGRLGTRVVAPNINLSDSPRYPATLPRSYDAEGVPVQPLPLIQDGVAHRTVHDSTTAAATGAASTGHAALPGGLAEPRAEHLVLVGGGAADLDELAAPMERGLLIGTLAGRSTAAPGAAASAVAEGVRAIRDGRIAEPLPSLVVRFEPLDLLSRVQALAARQRTIPAPDGGPGWSLGATVAPALRAAGGMNVGSTA